MQVEEFHYRVPWRARGSHPGHHSGRQTGGGFEFRGYAPLLAAPDPRRFDVRASLRDPFEQIVMRVYSQRCAIPVFAVADLSASMGFRGRRQKTELLADFTLSLGYSAYRTGDPFGFVGCDTAIRYDFVQPLTRAKGAGQAMSARLREFAPDGRDARGLLDAPRIMGRSRALVFLVSDFHFPTELLERILIGMAPHAVVPVVLWDRIEMAPPAYGIARVSDPETPSQRMLLMRPSVRERMRLAFEQREQELLDCFEHHGTKPLFVVDDFRADDVTRYFYA